jgi:hypothetical protein
MRSLKKRRLAQWSASADQGKVTEGVPTPVVQLSAIDPEKCRLFIGAYSLDPLSSTLLLLLFIHLYYYVLDPLSIAFIYSFFFIGPLSFALLLLIFSHFCYYLLDPLSSALLLSLGAQRSRPALLLQHVVECEVY